MPPKSNYLTDFLEQITFLQIGALESEKANPRSTISLPFAEQVFRLGCAQVMLHSRGDYTLLHGAVRLGDMRRMALFTEYFPQYLNAQTTINGYTPLHEAVNVGNRDAITFLLKQENIDTTMENTKMKTPQEFAKSRWEKSNPDLSKEIQSLFDNYYQAKVGGAYTAAIVNIDRPYYSLNDPQRGSHVLRQEQQKPSVGTGRSS